MHTYIGDSIIPCGQTVVSPGQTLGRLVRETTASDRSTKRLRPLHAYVLQSRQVKRTPQDSINQLSIWKMNPLVVPVTSIKFKWQSCMLNDSEYFNENFSASGQIENLWMDKICFENIYIKLREIEMVEIS